MPAIMATLGELVRERREAVGLTQQELAQRAGLAVQTVRKLEQGAGRAHWDTMVAISHALGVSLDAFRGADGGPSLPPPPGPSSGRAGRPGRPRQRPAGDDPA